jgi:uncharacterized protein YkwD
MRGLVLVATLLIAGVAAVALVPRGHETAKSPCGAVDVPPATAGADLAGRATLCLINDERAKHGLEPLASNALLAQAAQAHSADMVARRFFEHAAPDGRTVQDRIRATGFAGGRAASTGENIAWGSGAKSTPAAVVAKWMASPPHRADILRPAFREIGVGIADGAPIEPSARSDPGAASATYTTDFGGVVDPSLPSG